MELLIAFVAMFLAGAFTWCVLAGYGVNARNHGLFVKVLRLKAKGADATELGNAVFDYLMMEMENRNGKGRGRYDMRPVMELLKEREFDDVYEEVAKLLAEREIEPVFLDRTEKVLVIG